MPEAFMKKSVQNYNKILIYARIFVNLHPILRKMYILFCNQW